MKTAPKRGYPILSVFIQNDPESATFFKIIDWFTMLRAALMLEHEITNQKNFLFAPPLTTNYLDAKKFYQASQRFYSSDKWRQFDTNPNAEKKGLVGTAMTPGKLKRAIPLLAALGGYSELVGVEPTDFSPEETKPHQVLQASLIDAATLFNLISQGVTRDEDIIAAFPTQPVEKAQAYQEAIQSSPDPANAWRVIHRDESRVLTKTNEELEMRRNPEIFLQGTNLLDCLLNQPSQESHQTVNQVSCVFNPEKTSQNGTRIQFRTSFSRIEEHGHFTFFHLGVGEEILDFPYLFSLAVRSLLAGQALDLHCKDNTFYHQGEPYINKFHKIKSAIPIRSDYSFIVRNFNKTIEQREIILDLHNHGWLIKQLLALFSDTIAAHKSEVLSYFKTGKVPDSLKHHTTPVTPINAAPVYPNENGGVTIDLSNIPPKPKKTHCPIKHLCNGQQLKICHGEVTITPENRGFCKPYKRSYKLPNLPIH